MAHTSPDSSQHHDLASNLKLEKGHEEGHSPWLEALESRNCKTLKGLLKENRDLVRITSDEGRTVLHVAVIQGCLDLVEDILTLYGKCSLPEIFKARYQVLLTAKDGRCGGVTALGMAQEFLGMEKIIQCLQSGPSNNQQPTLNAQDDEYLTTVRDIIKVLLDEPEFEFLKASFDEDVDYNFHDIENNFELVFHHAFSEIGMEESQEESESMKFVLKVMEKCLALGKVGVTTLKFLLNLPNPQGRPPFHALLASSEYANCKVVYVKVNKLIDRIPNEGADLIHEAIVKVLDADGKTFRHRHVHGIIQQLFLTEQNFGILKASFDEDVDYNFHDIENNFELVFHHAFSILGMEESQEESESMKFVLKVMEECLALGEGVTTLKFLFNLPNAQGRPPFHALLASSKNGYCGLLYVKVNKLIDWLSEKLNPPTALKSCVTAPDAMGRTIFHRNVSMKPNEGLILYVFEHQKVVEFTDLNNLLNQRMKSCQEQGWRKEMEGQGGATALHLAILHNQPLNVEKLLQDTYEVDLNAILYRRIQYGHGGAGKGARWSPLQLAALLGNPSIVKLLLTKIESIYDVGKWKNSKLAKPKFYDEKMPALHLAAASGNSEVLQLFLYHPSFNQMKGAGLMNSKGARGNGKRTTLHLAADETIPFYKGLGADFGNRHIFKMVGTAVSLVDIDNHHMLLSNSMLQEDDTVSSKTIKTKVHNGKKQCMIMLLEVGLDMWQKDENGALPEPSWEATDGDNFWWHDRIRKQVIAAKKNLNAAGNAISVVAGLVATASYAGPLQPPLGFETHDSVTMEQVHHNLAVQVFVVSNSFSFLFAIVALMYSLMPSLPVSQENLFEEWRHSRRTVSISLIFLLLSVLSILISFAAANSAGMPDYKSVRHSYAFYPAIIGGSLCSIVIVLCFVRVLRLIKPENKTIASMHRAIVYGKYRGLVTS